MVLHLRVFLEGTDGGTKEVVLSFQSAASISLSSVKEQIGVDKHHKLQVFVPSQNSYHALRTDKDVVTLKNDSKLRIKKKKRKNSSGGVRESKRESVTLREGRTSASLNKESPIARNHHRRSQSLRESAHRNTTGGGPIFGVELNELLDRQGTGNVPVFVEQTIQWLRKHGMNEEGLFRVPPQQAHLDELRKEYDKRGIVDLEHYKPSVAVVACLLKLFFRELPQPLLIYRYYPTIIKVSRNPNVEQRLNNLKIIISKLPPANRDTLIYLLKFLNDVSQSSKVNKMNVSNLATVWGPNLIREPPDMASLTQALDSNNVNNVIETLITSASHFDNISLSIGTDSNGIDSASNQTVPPPPDSVTAMEIARKKQEELIHKSKELAEKKSQLQQELARLGGNGSGSSSGKSEKPRKPLPPGDTPPRSRQFQWAMTPSEKERLYVIFAKLDTNKDGFISPAEALIAFRESNLEKEILGRIWDLSDIDRDRKLDKDEFAIAMFLINARLKGNMIPIELPPSLLESVFGFSSPDDLEKRKQASANAPKYAVNTPDHDYRQLLRRPSLKNALHALYSAPNTMQPQFGRSPSAPVMDPRTSQNHLMRGGSGNVGGSYSRNPGRDTPLPPPLSDKEDSLSRSGSKLKRFDWREAISPEGKKYYYNRKTKQTSWVPPEEGYEPWRPRKTPAAVKDEWKEAIAPNGKKYYYNPLTKQSSWKKPTGVTTKPRVPASLSADSDSEPLLPPQKSKQRMHQTIDLMDSEDDSGYTPERRSSDASTQSEDIKSYETVFAQADKELAEIEQEERRLQEQEEKQRQLELMDLVIQQKQLITETELLEREEQLKQMENRVSEQNGGRRNSEVYDEEDEEERRFLEEKRKLEEEERRLLEEEELERQKRIERKQQLQQRLKLIEEALDNKSKGLQLSKQSLTSVS